MRSDRLVITIGHGALNSACLLGVGYGREKPFLSRDAAVLYVLIIAASIIGCLERRACSVSAMNSESKVLR